MLWKLITGYITLNEEFIFIIFQRQLTITELFVCLVHKDDGDGLGWFGRDDALVRFDKEEVWPFSFDLL